MPTKPPELRQFDLLEPGEFPPGLFEALGTFVAQYALIEWLFHESFEHYSGLSADVRRAIIGGTRLSGVIERIKRLMTLNAVAEDVVLHFERIESALNPLSQLRDKLVHWVWLPTSVGPMLNNAFSAKSVIGWLNSKEFITPAEINENRRKLAAIALHLVLHTKYREKYWDKYLSLCSPEMIADMQASGTTSLETLVQQFPLP